MVNTKFRLAIPYLVCSGNGVDRRDVERDGRRRIGRTAAGYAVRIAELIESVGLPNVKEPHVRHLRGQLWEIRLKGKAGIARALYVTAKEQRVVIVRAS